MRKAFIALGVICVALFIALGVYNQQPKYAGVSMPKSDYQHLKQSRSDINQLMTNLQKFDSSDAKTMSAIESSADIIIKHNRQNLSQTDINILKDSFYGSQGIVTIVRAAKKGNYNIDSSVASRFHSKLNTIIDMSVNAINKSSAQRSDIVEQMKKDLHVDDALYKIGSQNE